MAEGEATERIARYVLDGKFRGGVYGSDRDQRGTATFDIWSHPLFHLF